MIHRGDVVIVQFPYVSGAAGKNKPALLVQSDRNNQRLQNTVVAMITGNVSRVASEPTQVLIDPSTTSGQSSGLRGPSAIKCEDLFTVVPTSHPAYDWTP
jgi:mRNA-degrading endonuclease toxin of MazEF toxin-antitoxin module